MPAIEDSVVPSYPNQMRQQTILIRPVPIAGTVVRSLCFIIITATPIRYAAGSDHLLTGKAAMGDWTSDAPGVRRQITAADLPLPGSNFLTIKPPRVVTRPVGTE